MHHTVNISSEAHLRAVWPSDDTSAHELSVSQDCRSEPESQPMLVIKEPGGSLKGYSSRFSHWNIDLSAKNTCKGDKGRAHQVKIDGVFAHNQGKSIPCVNWGRFWSFKGQTIIHQQFPAAACGVPCAGCPKPLLEVHSLDGFVAGCG